METKQKKLISVEKSTLYINLCSVEDIIAELQSLSNMHGKNLYIQECTEKYSDDKYFAVMNKELETDEQFAARIELEDKWQKERDESDRKAFLRLKEKFKE